ncbi:tetratricopeptide repeat protein [uncultured Marivirga sp.]|uniref:tetratricopeptide repeat protein n=1 Tax=uncultured Marivirga sp. TaxID=1123707 RepID=UPI0030EE40BB|tara:strand:- start:166544 stop:167305 length:762 start_codon:yes stop_codon:yes gene_type:complete
MRFILLSIVFILSIELPVFSQSKLKAAEEYFSKKYNIIENGKANSQNIDRAIQLFGESTSEPDKTIGLLKSYEFKASWTEVSESEKRDLYEKAIALAKSKAGEYPNNGAIAYWYSANYARWANLIEITEAAQEGVLDKIKKLTERAIELDKKYNQAGALRLLGGLHMEAPSIPLILSWPSNEVAEKLLKKAYSIAPEHTANVYLYAKILHVIGKEKKAQRILKELTNRQAREQYFLVDKKYIQKGNELYTENY